MRDCTHGITRAYGAEHHLRRRGPRCVRVVTKSYPAKRKYQLIEIGPDKARKRRCRSRPVTSTFLCWRSLTAWRNIAGLLAGSRNSAKNPGGACPDQRAGTLMVASNGVDRFSGTFFPDLMYDVTAGAASCAAPELAADIHRVLTIYAHADDIEDCFFALHVRGDGHLTASITDGRRGEPARRAHRHVLQRG